LLVRLVSAPPFRSLAQCALLALVLSGCASDRWIGDRATAYNKALERTGNQELLLNVLRASRRRPEYFSYISQIHGGSGLNLPSASVGGAFNTPQTSPITANVTLGYVGTASFDVGALDTADFLRGITSAVSLETITRYWGQDWSPELLWFLLVRRVEVHRMPNAASEQPHSLWTDRWPAGTRTNPTAPDAVYFDNYPGSDEDFLAFKWISQRLLDAPFGIHPREALYRVDMGPPIDARQVQEARGLWADPKQEVTVRTLADGRFQLQRAIRTFEFTVAGACPGDVRTTGHPASAEIEHDQAPPRAGCKPSPQRITIYLRSPEGIQFYLGELVRAGLRRAAAGEPNPLTVRICARRGSPPRETLLFDVRRLAAGETTPLDVEFEGERYGVPAEPPNADEFAECDAQNTMHVLSFVSQLLSLQRSARDLPSTGVVHVLQ
jgi:hypothetical protein